MKNIGYKKETNNPNKIPNSSDHSDLKEGATVKLSWKSADTRALDFKA